MNSRFIKKAFFSILLVLAVLVTITACGNENIEDLTYDGSLLITGLDEEIEILYDDIYSNEDDKKSTSVKGLTSAEELLEFEVTGLYLSDILANYDYSMDDFESIRLMAGDGYGINVPKELFQKKDIILAYYIDGKPIDSELQPLRAFINDERTMYWVSNLIQINLTLNGVVEEGDAVESLEKVVLLETAVQGLEIHEYNYGGNIDEAVNVSDLLDSYVNNKTESVYFVAADGFKKSEKLKVLEQGIIKMTGEFAPLFTGQDLPEGMQLKDILFLDIGDTTFMSINKALDTYNERTIDNQVGIALDDLIGALGLEGDTYIFTAKDGYSAEIGKENLKDGIITKSESEGYEQYNLIFNDSLPCSNNIDELLMIEVEASDAVKETVSESGNFGEWEITVEGLSDGSFVFSSQKAESNLDLIELQATMVKQDNSETEQLWKGYRLLDILSFLHVEDFNSITAVASDGYEVELSKEQVNEDTILGIELDGQRLSDESNLVQLVNKNTPSSKWVKGIAKIIVK